MQGVDKRAGSCTMAIGTNKEQDMMHKYGTTKASRAMESQDREKDLLRSLIGHLADNPLADPTEQFDTIRMLVSMDRRSR